MANRRYLNSSSQITYMKIFVTTTQEYCHRQLHRQLALIKGKTQILGPLTKAILFLKIIGRGIIWSCRPPSSDESPASLFIISIQKF